MKTRQGSLLTVFGLSLLAVAACQTTTPVPEYNGAMLYKGYCASCHGVSGKGDGPFTANLLAQLPILQTIQARNNGVFPRASLVTLIRGEGVSLLHGAVEMPVWGWAFNVAELRMGEKDPGPFADARIDALINHLESMQVQP